MIRVLEASEDPVTPQIVHCQCKSEAKAQTTDESTDVLTRLVESKMSILPDPSEEQLDSTKRLDLLLVSPALRDQIGYGSVQDVDRGWRDVDVLEDCEINKERRSVSDVAFASFVWAEVPGLDLQFSNMKVWYDWG